MTWEEEISRIGGIVDNDCEEYILGALGDELALGHGRSGRTELPEWIQETAWESLENGNVYRDRDYCFDFPTEFDPYIIDAVDYVDMSLFTDAYGIECVLDDLYDQCETMMAIDNAISNAGTYFACAMAERLDRNGVKHDAEAFSGLLARCRKELDGLCDEGSGYDDIYELADELERDYIAAIG